MLNLLAENNHCLQSGTTLIVNFVTVCFQLCSSNSFMQTTISCRTCDYPIAIHEYDNQVIVSSYIHHYIIYKYDIWVIL